MRKVLKRVRKLSSVAYVDDEREDGSSIIVTLNEGGGVQGFDTVAQAQAETIRDARADDPDHV